jgi:hypothetical protein
MFILALYENYVEEEKNMFLSGKIDETNTSLPFEI